MVVAIFLAMAILALVNGSAFQDEAIVMGVITGLIAFFIISTALNPWQDKEGKKRARIGKPKNCYCGGKLKWKVYSSIMGIKVAECKNEECNRSYFFKKENEIVHIYCQPFEGEMLCSNCGKRTMITAVTHKRYVHPDKTEDIPWCPKCEEEPKRKICFLPTLPF